MVTFSCPQFASSSNGLAARGGGIGSHEKGRGEGYRLEYAASSGVQLERELEKREHHPVATNPITQNDDHP